MQRDRHLIDVGQDARHVRRGGEAADLQRPVRMAPQLVLEMTDVDASVAGRADRHEIRDRLSPGQLVGVVLVGADEHDRPCGGIELEQAHELVDRAGRARAAEEDDIVIAALHRPVDDAAGVLPQRGGATPGRRCLGMRVAVRRQHLIAYEVLDEGERAPGGGRIRVDDAARPEWALDHDVIADHRRADPLDQAVGRELDPRAAPPRDAARVHGAELHHHPGKRHGEHGRPGRYGPPAALRYVDPP